MPWNPNDATRFTKKATSPASQRQWSATANNVLSRTGDEGRAVKIANGVVRKPRKVGPGRGMVKRGTIRRTQLRSGGRR